MKKLRPTINLFSVLFESLVTYSITVHAQFNNSTLVAKLWEHSTGTPDTIDWSSSALDGSGNLIVVGNTMVTTNNTDMLITKYATDGTVLWQVQYNHTNNNRDYGVAVAIDASDDIYVAGTSITSSGNGYDWVIQKYDDTGSLIWQSIYNGPGSSYDVPTDMVLDGAGAVYVVGASYGATSLSDYCTRKYSASNGTFIWEARYDYTSLLDIPAAITLGSSARVYVTGGSASSFTNWDFATVKYNATTGAQITVTRNSSSGLGLDHPTALAKDEYDNIYVTGAASSGAQYDIKTVKLDDELNTLWSVTWDNVGLDDQANSIGVDVNGYVYLTGYTKKANNGSDFITMKYNSSGTLQWQKFYPAPDETKIATARKLDIAPYGDILVTGDVYNISNKDFLTLAYDASGNIKFQEWFVGIGSGDDIPIAVKADVNNLFYVTGKVWTGTQYVYLTVKYEMIEYITPPSTETCPGNFAYYENNGQVIGTDQTDVPNVKYYTQNQFPDIYMQNNKINYVFLKSHQDHSISDTIHRIDLSFQNGLSTKVYKISPRIAAYNNYFKPWCPNGITSFGYQRLLYPEIYNDVDLMWYGNESGSKLYYTCKVGSRPTDIIMKFDGATSITILGNGKLKIISSVGNVIYDVASAFQIDNSGNIVTLAWSPTYTSAGTGKVKFTLGSYNTALPLIIEMKLLGNPDPIIGCDHNICWSTYYGHVRDEAAWDVTTDVAGNSYICGTTGSSEFPVLLNIQTLLGNFSDAFVLKFNELNERQWATWYGGATVNTGSINSQETAYAIAIGTNMDIIFAGTTPDMDFPVKDFDASNTDDYYKDESDGNETGFIASLNTSGNLKLWGTYIENPVPVEDEVIYDVVVDAASKKIYAVGQNAVASSVFGPAGSYQQSSSYNRTGSIIMFNEDYEVEWSSYYGAGQSSSVPSDNWDKIQSAALDPSGNLYLTGTTRASSTISCSTPSQQDQFPVCNSIGATFFQDVNTGGNFGLNFDAYVAKFNTTHALEYASLFRGNGNDYGNAIAVSGSPNKIYITGSSTYSPSLDVCGSSPSANAFPLCNSLQSFISGSDPDAFTAVFSDDFDLLFSTYLGKSSIEEGLGIAVDPSGNFFVVGYTGSSNFYVNSFQYYYDHGQFGGNDMFITEFDASYAIKWSTYYGGQEEGNSNFPVYDESAHAIHVTSDYQLYVVGDAASIDVPIIYSGNAYWQYYADNSAPQVGQTVYDAFILRANVDPNFTEVDNMDQINSQLVVFPNPAQSEIKLKYPLDVDRLEIFNSLGTHYISVGNLNKNGELLINTSTFPRGIYLIRCIGEDRVLYNTKLVLQ